MYDGIWHRAMIVETAEQIRVHYIDFGTVDEVEFDNLFYLRLTLATYSTQAIRGSLFDVKPKTAETHWTHEASIRFHELINGIQFNAVIKDIDHEVRFN